MYEELEFVLIHFLKLYCPFFDLRANVRILPVTLVFGLILERDDVVGFWPRMKNLSCSGYVCTLS
uniref:Uncharacterized protein n=1 Tax=Solanum lycopersicum TaxID=4081 RepID=A0A3Q7JL40_SOLLC